jgi:hypothetical protein
MQDLLSISRKYFALLDPTDIGQVEHYLESLATEDPTYWVQSKDVRKMAAMLRDPFVYEVRQPDEKSKQLMNQWVLGGNARNIPKCTAIGIDQYLFWCNFQPAFSL